LTQKDKVSLAPDGRPFCRSVDAPHSRGGRNWASLWKPLIDAFGPVLGEDPTRPFHPHDDRIVSPALHHTTGIGIAHDVIIDAGWTRL
jgi:hypothetical protein